MPDDKTAATMTEPGSRSGDEIRKEVREDDVVERLDDDVPHGEGHEVARAEGVENLWQSTCYTHCEKGKNHFA